MKTPAKWMTRVLISGFAIGLATLCLLPLGAQADTLYWDFGGTPVTLWSTATNWDKAADGTGGNPGSPPGASDTAVFNVTSLNTSAQTATLNGNLSVQGLVFTNTGQTTVVGDAVAHRTVTLGSGGIVVHPGAGNVIIGGAGSAGRKEFDYILDGAQSWINNSLNTLTISFSSTTTYNITNAGYLLTIGGSGNISISPSPTIMSGSGGLTKSGTGTLTMGMRGSTFTGPTTINGGVLLAESFANINTASSLGRGSAGGGGGGPGLRRGHVGPYRGQRGEFGSPLHDRQ